jgi:hypothetical protein
LGILNDIQKRRGGDSELNGAIGNSCHTPRVGIEKESAFSDLVQFHNLLGSQTADKLP